MTTQSLVKSFPRILYVDDDDTLRALMKFQLENVLSGPIVTCLDSVHSAIVHLSALPAADKPDLIFTDLNMPPGRNGWALAQWLQHSPHYAGTPVIMATTDISGEPTSMFQIDKGIYGGYVADYLKKPVSLEALEVLLRRLRPDWFAAA